MTALSGYGVERPAEAVPARRRLRTRLAPAMPPLVAAAALLAIWEIAALSHIKPSWVLPPPSDVWQTFTTQWQEGHVTQAVANSLGRCALGFAISLVLGTPLGLAVARSRPLRLAIGPLLSGLQSLPSVTWVPVGIIWFGLTPTTILFVVVMGALPSIANGLVSAVDTIPPALPRAGRAMGASRLALYRHVILPAALPGYIAGMRQGWAFAWRSLMAAELITFSPDLGLGLGQLLDAGRQELDMSLVVMSIIVILVVGVVVEALVLGPLERRTLRVRGLGPQAAGALPLTR